MSGPLSLTQAAKVSGRAKATISKAIRKGELSAKQEGNAYLIEPSELFRVFPAETGTVTDAEPPANPPADPALQVRVEMLERLLAQAEAALEREREDRQAAEARAEEERRRIDRLLPPPEPRRRWFTWKAR